jgi:deoxyribose-phosphate aldolase
VQETIGRVRERVERLVGPVRTGAGTYQPTSADRLADSIDHTLLKAEATAAQVTCLCAEAREHGFHAVCLNPAFVRQAARELGGSRVSVCTVIGFPLGATTNAAKTAEARQAVEDGAGELDMVLRIGALVEEDWQGVFDDVRAVVDAAGAALVKVILEACLLSEEQKVAGALLSVAAGARYVKTSTGFSTGGATPEDVRLLRTVVGPQIGVKAAGGIRTRADAAAMLAAGASRLGCSASVAIVQPESVEVAQTV